MKCVEFERVLPDYLEGNHSPAQQAHLRTCPDCANLVSDLRVISAQAKALIAAEEPSPLVWNLVAARLQQEGLIRRPRAPRSRLGGLFTGWRIAVAPLAAAIAIVAAIKLRSPMKAGDTQPIAKPPVTASVPATKTFSSEDQQLLTVTSSIPAKRAKYRADLEDANSFIRDAEQSVKDDASDMFTQQMLINAYEQKQMLFQLAVDQSGPEAGEQ